MKYLGSAGLANWLDTGWLVELNPGKFGKLNKDEETVPNNGPMVLNLPVAIMVAFGIPDSNGFPRSNGPE